MTNDFIDNDGTISICGVKIDNPLSYIIPRYEYSEHKDGKTTTRELWVNGYHRINEAYVCWSYKLSITNRGKAMLDDKTLKDADQNKVKYIFDNIRFA